MISMKVREVRKVRGGGEAINNGIGEAQLQLVSLSHQQTYLVQRSCLSHILLVDENRGSGHTGPIFYTPSLIIRQFLTLCFWGCYFEQGVQTYSSRINRPPDQRTASKNWCFDFKVGESNNIKSQERSHRVINHDGNPPGFCVSWTELNGDSATSVMRESYSARNYLIDSTLYPSQPVPIRNAHSSFEFNWSQGGKNPCTPFI